MIKAVLFDYDGVITTGIHTSSPAKILSDNLGVSKKVAAEWVGQIWTDLLTGRISQEDVRRHIEKKYGSPVSAEQCEIWYKKHELMPQPHMIEMIVELKTNGYHVGLISNATTETKAIIQEYGVYDIFDFIKIGRAHV